MLIRYLSENRAGCRMGMGHYERNLLRALHEFGGGQLSRDALLSGRRAGPSDLEPETGDFNDVRALGFSPVRLHQWPWWMAKSAINLADRRSRLAKPDLYHGLSLGYPLPSRAPSVLTIHDFPPARFDDEGTPPRWAKHAANAARAIHVPSKFAAEEIKELFDIAESKLHVIPYGCENDRFGMHVQPATPEQLAKHKIDGPYIFFAAGASQRKNVAGLLKAWRMIAKRFDDLTLVLAGPQIPLQRLISESKATHVSAIGYVDREELPRLLKSARALVCPSIYEGFGMPPLEALACGVPVASVRAGALPEVTGGDLSEGGAAALAADGSPDAIADAMLRLLDNPNNLELSKSRGPSQAGKFTWKSHASSIIAMYRSVLQAN